MISMMIILTTDTAAYSLRANAHGVVLLRRISTREILTINFIVLNEKHIPVRI